MNFDSLVPYINALKSTSIIPYCPEEPTPKQLEFLRMKQKEVLYGGAASGGKSSALLMAALQYVMQPDYSCLILRRSYTDLARPGAIMDRARTWLSRTDAHWNGIEKTWTFPSGAKIAFGYLETEADKYRYTGSELNAIFFDELSQFEESQYLYLMTRLRRKAKCNIPLRMRGATNPGGIGHQFCKTRFVTSADPDIAFLPARVVDNPHVDQESYIKVLNQLDDTTRRQLLLGEWITDAQMQLYKFNQERNTADKLPDIHRTDRWHYVLGIDLGASQVSATTAFVIVAFSNRLPESYVIHAECHSGMYPSSIAEHIKTLQRAYGHMYIVIDEGALGKGYGEEFRRRYAIPTTAAQKTDKLGYRRLINGAFERSEIMLLPGTDGLQTELINLIWDDKGLDAHKGQACHYSDALLYAWRESRSHLAQFAAKLAAERGTPEWLEEEEERMKNNLINRDKEAAKEWY